MIAPLRPLSYVDLLMSMATILIGRREWVTHQAGELGQIQTTQPSASVSISTTGADSGTFLYLSWIRLVKLKTKCRFLSTRARVHQIHWTWYWKRTPPRNDFDAHITWSCANRQPCLLWQIWGVLMRRKLNFCWRLFNLLYYAIWRLHPSEIPTFMAYFVYYMVLTHFDSKDDYRTGCRNVSHCQQQSYSGLRSPGRSCSTYLWNNSWVQTVHRVWCNKTFF